MRQTNFAAGEIDPLLQGRTDLPIYGSGLRTCRNFFITREGAAMSRPGTTFVRETGLSVFMSGGRDIGRVRLIPFVAGDAASYVLEVGHEYIKFHSLGRTVEAPPGTPYSLVTTWQVEDLSLLRFAQVGDTLTVVNAARHPGAWELRYEGPAVWALSEVTYQPPPALFPDIAASAGASPFNPTAAETYGTTPFMLVFPLPVPDPDHPAREWRWGCTAILQEVATGIILESLMTEVTQSTDGVEDLVTFNPVRTALADNSVAVYPDAPVTLTRLALGSAVGAGYKVIAFNIYRGAGDLFGFVGQTRGRTFVDVGRDPDYTVQPPIGTNPFRIQLDAPSFGGRVEAVERPAAVAFFQERRCFGRNGGAARLLPYDSSLVALTTRKQPRLHLSSTGNYFDFDTRLSSHVAGEALDLVPASRKRESLRHLVEAGRLVVLTDATARALGGTQGPLDYDDIDFPVVDEVGSSDVVPLVIDGAVLFVRSKGSGARALVPSVAGVAPFHGLDLSGSARHLVLGGSRTIVDWCYQEDPWGVVWAVRADGALLSLTFSRERSVVAWGRHDSEGGDATFEAICSVPEGEEDAVYAVVVRTVEGEPRRYIERLTSRVRRVLETDDPPTFTTDPGRTDTDSLYPTDVCLDCAFTYADVPTDTITSENLAHLIGKQVYVVARGSPVIGPLEVTDDGSGNGTITLGLDELPATNAVDDADAPIWVAHVGLAYTCDLETLAVRGPTALQQRTIRAVGFELDNARGVQTGQDFDNLDDWQQREVSDGNSPIVAQTTLLYATPANAWDRDARACLRQSLPLPVAVIGITREVVGSDP